MLAEKAMTFTYAVNKLALVLDVADLDPGIQRLFKVRQRLLVMT